MKPPGGNYKPNRIAVGKALGRMAAGKAPGRARAAAESECAKTDGGVTARVMTASPIELILMMYEQLFGLIPEIKRSIGRNSAAAAEPDAERAQAIVEELINSLDFSVGISADLGAIYFYVRNLILEANIKFDAAIWDRVEALMRPLYEGFREAARQAEPAPMPEIGGADPSILAGFTYGQGNLKEIVVNTRSGLRV